MGEPIRSKHSGPITKQGVPGGGEWQVNSVTYFTDHRFASLSGSGDPLMRGTRLPPPPS